jgi:hypothetical protein
MRIALAKRRAGRELPVGDEFSECVGNHVTLADVFAPCPQCWLPDHAGGMVAGLVPWAGRTVYPVTRLAHGLRVLMMEVAGS